MSSRTTFRRLLRTNRLGWAEALRRRGLEDLARIDRATRRHLLGTVVVAKFSARADALEGSDVDVETLGRLAAAPEVAGERFYATLQRILEILDVEGFRLPRESARLPPSQLAEHFQPLADAVRASPTLDHLGEIHQHCERRRLELSEGELAVGTTGARRDSGLFFTPSSLASHVVEGTLETLEHSTRAPWSLRILDPAAGSGALLSAALGTVAPLLRESKPQRGEIAMLRHLLSRTLAGVDLDRDALALAGWNLRFAALDAAEEPVPLGALGVEPRLVHGDALVFATADEAVDAESVPPSRAYDEALQRHHGIDPESRPPLHWSLEFGDLFGETLDADDGFDAVVGNPPWVSYGLRDAGSRDDRLETYLRRRFSRSAQYKLPTHPLFVELGVQLASDGGALGFLLPDSFLTGSRFSKLRDLLLDETDLEELTILADNVWSGGTAGRCVVLEARKGGRDGTGVRVRRIDSEGDLRRGEGGERLPVEGLVAGEHRRFELLFDDAARELVATMRRDTVPLGDRLSFYSGCISRYGQDAVQSDTPEPRWSILDGEGQRVVDDAEAERHWRPLIPSGRHVQPHELLRTGRVIFVHPDPDMRRQYAKSGFDPTRYERPKLLIRQTGDGLVAARDDRGAFCLNNLHVANRRAAGVDLYVMEALLNSAALNAYYRAVSLEKGRRLAQTDLEMLRALPVPGDLDLRDSRLPALARERSRLGSQLADWDSLFIRAARNGDGDWQRTTLGELLERRDDLEARPASPDAPSGRITDLELRATGDGLVLRAAVDEECVDVIRLVGDVEESASTLYVALRAKLRREWRRRVWGRGAPFETVLDELEIQWPERFVPRPEEDLLEVDTRARETQQEMDRVICERYAASPELVEQLND